MSEDEQQKKLPSVEDNGKRTMPDMMEAQVDAWLKEGRRIIEKMEWPSLTIRREGVFCMVSVDEEMTRFVVEVIQTVALIRREKQAQDKKAQTEKE